MADPALSGPGVVLGPYLTVAANNTVVANLTGASDYPRNTPISELAAAIGTLSYQGTWNASTNTPTIVSGVGTNGYYYVVSVAGTTNIDGISSWDVGDWIIFNSTAGAWQQIASGTISNAEINTALGNPISLGVGFSTAGSGSITLTSTGITNVTLPTTGTLATVAATLQVANNLSDLNSASAARSNLGLGTAAVQNVGAFLQPTNNLSDVSNASTARTNLGLGTAAVQADSFFLQAANNLSDVVTPATARTNLGLGTAATFAATAFAQTANNLSDLANAATARTNLGLGTAATQASTVFAQVANNLSDLANATTARTNLGLGTSATFDVGTGANNIVQLTAGGILPAVDGSQLTNLPPAGGGLLAANNLSDVASAATSRTNLGLGTAATQNSTAFAQVANNLSDLASASTARVNLVIDQMTTHGDSIYSIQTTDRTVALTATLTAPRVWTLPAANGVNAGQQIVILDLASGVSTTNYIAITRAGADTINGTTAVNFTAPYGRVVVTSDGTSAWEAQSFASVATSGSAADLTTGTLPSARLSGSYTGITAVGTLSSLATGATTITPAADNSALVVSGYSLTGATVDAAISVAGTWNTSGIADAITVDITNTASDASSRLINLMIGGASQFQVTRAGVTFSRGLVGAVFATAIPAGGVQGLRFSTTATFGINFGSGAPTVSAAQGSLYLRSDGAPYYNTNGTTGWIDLVPSTVATLSSLTTVGTLSSLGVSGVTTLTSNSATSLTVGPNGATNPVLQIDSSTGSQAAGLKLTGATSAGTVALGVLSSGSNANLSIDAKGSGTITIAGTSTGAITLTRATTLSAALTYGGVALNNAVTGTGNMVLSASPTFTGTVTAAAVTADTYAVSSSNVNTQTGTSYTLVNGDNGKTVTLSNASAITLTVPSGLTAGFNCLLVQLGAGQVTITASSTTLRSYNSALKISGQYGQAMIAYISSDTYSVGGTLSA